MNTSTKKSYYQVGGCLPGNSPNYVKRKADIDLYHSLKAGEFCYVLNSRQMGKSSLQVRTIQKLQLEDISCVAIDISEIGNRGVTPEQWYAGILRILENNFNLSEYVNIRTWWRERDFLAPVQRLSEFIETVLLTQINKNIVIFIDEIDSILALDFPVDDFFGFIRGCYNKRAHNREYNRLTFALLGVCTPQDLCQDQSSTPFNIGRAIKLMGFQLDEALPLVGGLREICEHPEAVLKEVLFWTGGQPFLTQKICRLLIENWHSIIDPEVGVKEIVRSKVIHNWEAQDVPEHLKTIRDRIFRKDNRIIRRLGLYQQILLDNFTGIIADNSSEEMELRLSGLIVKRDNQLTVANPIYAEVFNQETIVEELEKLPPYSEKIKPWLNSKGVDKSYLLEGEDLQSALIWAAGKSLRNQDFQFLTASQKLVLDTQTESLELTKIETKKAQAEVTKAQKKAKRWISIGSAILGTSLILSIGFSLLAYQRFKLAQSSREIEQTGTDALLLALFKKSATQSLLEALPKAVSAGKKLKSLVNNNTPLAEYPATRPILALQMILDKLDEQEQFQNNLLQKRKLILSGHQGAVTSVKFSPNQQVLASAGVDGKVVIWNLEGKKIREWQTEQKSVNSIVFHPDGKYVVTAGSNGTVKIWNLLGEKLYVLKISESEINSISISPDGKSLATAGIDIPVKLWNLSWSPITILSKSILADNGLIRTVSFSPEKEFLATLDGKSTIRLWNLSENQFKTLDVQVISMNFSISKPQLLVTATSNGIVQLWQLSRGNLVNDFQTLHLDTKLVNFSPDGEVIATVGIDSIVRLWNLSGRQISQFAFPENVISISFSSDSKKIAVAGSNGKVWLRSVEDLDELLTQSCNFLAEKPNYFLRVVEFCHS
ncbi:MAG: AAA-like domain-containing protein [Microcoleaceae cyanobacterium MO_207.B10]|nr:AAA-like domain-containing protein [Microcoleaceae cyanobacterium MO_207.B10]